MTAQPTERPRLWFSVRQKLRRPPEFEAVHAQGRRSADGFFTVTARPNDQGVARLGLAVSVKAAGGAVGRNRVRRIVRESFRLHQHTMPPLDMVVAARSRVREASREQLRTSIAGLWNKVAKQCAASSAS